MTIDSIFIEPEQIKKFIENDQEKEEAENKDQNQ
jgi:hypothetical protein